MDDLSVEEALAMTAGRRAQLAHEGHARRIQELQVENERLRIANMVMKTTLAAFRRRVEKWLSRAPTIDLDEPIGLVRKSKRRQKGKRK